MTHSVAGAAPEDPRDARDPMARLRLSIIAPLLSMPLERGDLRARLEQMSQQLWKHPSTGEPIRFAASTLERWYYTARDAADPLRCLRRRLRGDAGRSSALTPEAQQALLAQYHEHPQWSQELHHDNLAAQARTDPSLGSIPSTSTLGRFLRARGLLRHRRPKTDTAGARRSAARFERLEVRSFEVPYVGALWHLDFHVGSRRIVTRQGASLRPVLLGILDDHSRLCCHLQWSLGETAEHLVHGLRQAVLKRGLPRALMTDNGAAMLATETRAGLRELSIEHELTLCYAPYQNGKQESFWQIVEGRLLALLDHESDLTLTQLNELTQIWVEQDYHQRVHSSLKETPLARYRRTRDVLRPCPDPEVLDRAFCRQEPRRARRSDGSVSVGGVRFEVPSAFAALSILHLRYASWDLSRVHLVDPRSGVLLARLRPQDKVRRADGHRAPRALPPGAVPERETPSLPRGQRAALLQQMLDRARDTGIPRSIPKDEDAGPSRQGVDQEGSPS